MDKKFLFYFFAIMKALRFLPRKKYKIFFGRRVLIAAFIALLLWLLFFAINKYHTPELPKENSVAVLYANQLQNLESTYLDAIYKAKTSILVISYSIRDTSIIRALNAQAKRGVNVTVISDAGTSQNLRNQLGASIKFYTNKNNGLMHLKMMVIDDNQVWAGSANMTSDSLNRNGNLVVGVNSPILANATNEQARQIMQLPVKSSSYTILQLPEQKIELWFLPTDGSAAFHRLMNLLYQAKTSIQIAMYTWTHPRLAEAVIDAHDRGVNVEVILDRDQALDPGLPLYKRFIEAGVNVALSPSIGVLHYKMAWIDKTILVNGSANWTLSAFNRNDECFLVIDPLSQQQQQIMDRLWRVISSEATKENLLLEKVTS